MTTEPTAADASGDEDFNEPDGCFLIGHPDGTVTDPLGTADLSALNRVTPPRNPYAEMMKDARAA